MNRGLPGLSPLWLMILALVLGVFLVVAVPVVISAATINSTAWIGFAGSSMTGLIALFAVLYGAANVRRQLRVNLLSREEERMEIGLPGLREVAGALNFMLPRMKKPDPKAIYDSLRFVQSDLDLSDFPSPYHQELQGEPGPVTDESLKKVVPQADQLTRQRLLVILQAIDREAVAAKRGEGHSNLRTLVLMATVRELFVFETDIVAKIGLYERRLKQFREELELYFDETDAA